MTENLQPSLNVFRVGRELENKVVSTFLEENLGFREVIHLRKNQGIPSRVGNSNPPSQVSSAMEPS